MPPVTREDPYGGYNFIVTVNGVSDDGNADSTESAATPTDAKEANDRPLPPDRPQPTSRAVSSSAPQCFELNVTSVVPFVALGVLSRLGYFEVVSTALRAAANATDMRCLVVGLAYKMLPSPRRGWHRSNADQHTAAAVAGLPDPVSGEELDRFAFRCADCLSPADGYTKLLLSEGPDPACAIVIHQLAWNDQPLWVLLDSQGGFPLGWFFSQEEMLPALVDFAGNTFLVSEAAAEPSLLAALGIRQQRFVTSLPPSRQDRWRAIDRHRSLWTNDLEAQTGWLLRQGQFLPVATESAERVTQAFILDRPVLSRAEASQTTRAERSRYAHALLLEQHLALAAASALGTIAWQLWGDNESTDPLMALERLGNLDGRVTVDRQRVTVRPALGRRYQDLRDHNMLVDVAHLPWLAGRRLEFAGL